MEEEKQNLRRSFLNMRRAISLETVESRSYKISQRLRGLLRNDLKNILFYVPINREVDLLPLARELCQEGKNVLFPRITEQGNIEASVVTDFTKGFKKGAFNIPEPTGPVYRGPIDLGMIPGVVFGKNGYRIGYGKSFYDRFLNSGQVNFSVGVCFDFQLLSSVPHSEHDYQLDGLVSEHDWIPVIRE